MLYIGEHNKTIIIKEYYDNNKIDKVYVFGVNDIAWSFLNISNYEIIKFTDLQKYVYFYRLLQEITSNSLIVVNDCLKRDSRRDLTYNCIRKYIVKTKHRIVFNYFPIKTKKEDIMILYDFISEQASITDEYKYITKFNNIYYNNISFKHTIVDTIDLSNIEKEYNSLKLKEIANINKDYNTVPRRLLKYVENYKIKLGYKFDSLANVKNNMKIVLSNLKVDQYYYNKLLSFEKELLSVIEKIQQ